MYQVNILSNASVCPPHGVVVAMANLQEMDPVCLSQVPCLPAWIQEQSSILPEKRRREFLAGRFLLADLLQRYWQQSQLPDLMVSDNAKPIFCDPSLPQFNISHSGDRIAVGVSCLEPIGLDIEKHRVQPNRQKIAQVFFSVQEREWLTQQEDENAAFWQLWTLREAALKLHGKGVWQMKQLQLIPETGYIISDFASKVHCHYQVIKDVHISLCCQTPLQPLPVKDISAFGFTPDIYFAI